MQRVQQERKEDSGTSANDEWPLGPPAVVVTGGHEGMGEKSGPKELRPSNQPRAVPGVGPVMVVPRVNRLPIPL